MSIAVLMGHETWNIKHRTYRTIREGIKRFFNKISPSRNAFRKGLGMVLACAGDGELGGHLGGIVIALEKYHNRAPHGQADSPVLSYDAQGYQFLNGFPGKRPVILGIGQID